MPGSWAHGVLAPHPYSHTTMWILEIVFIYSGQYVRWGEGKEGGILSVHFRGEDKNTRQTSSSSYYQVYVVHIYIRLLDRQV